MSNNFGNYYNVHPENLGKVREVLVKLGIPHTISPPRDIPIYNCCPLCDGDAIVYKIMGGVRTDLSSRQFHRLLVDHKIITSCKCNDCKKRNKLLERA